MADNSAIEWTDATRVVDRDGRRVRLYHRVDTTRPGQQERRRKAVEGLRWCRECIAWLPAADLTKTGLCRAHEAATHRRRYAESATFRESRKAHSTRRQRGVERIPIDAAEMLMEWFEGRCAYCPAPAESWDHFEPVARGGQTVPGNMLPACRRCNSSKRDGDPLAFLDRAPNVHPAAIELLELAGRL